MGINHSQREAAGCQLSRQFHPSVSHIEVSVAWLKVSFATLSLSRLAWRRSHGVGGGMCCVWRNLRLVACHGSDHGAGRSARNVPLKETFKGVMPFLVSDLLRILLLVFFPIITLYLVRTFGN